MTRWLTDQHSLGVGSGRDNNNKACQTFLVSFLKISSFYHLLADEFWRKSPSVEMVYQLSLVQLSLSYTLAPQYIYFPFWK